jgi:hypothetical protein
MTSDAPEQSLTEPTLSDVDASAEPFAVAAIAVLSLTWFGVSWLLMGSPVTDAVGEAAGGVAAVLVLVSVVGAIRQSRLVDGNP